MAWENMYAAWGWLGLHPGVGWLGLHPAHFGILDIDIRPCHLLLASNIEYEGVQDGRMCSDVHSAR